jgi:hypothetical protein
MYCRARGLISSPQDISILLRRLKYHYSIRGFVSGQSGSGSGFDTQYARSLLIQSNMLPQLDSVCHLLEYGHAHSPLDCPDYPEFSPRIPAQPLSVYQPHQMENRCKPARDSKGDEAAYIIRGTCRGVHARHATVALSGAKDARAGKLGMSEAPPPKA